MYEVLVGEFLAASVAIIALLVFRHRVEIPALERARQKLVEQEQNLNLACESTEKRLEKALRGVQARINSMSKNHQSSPEPQQEEDGYEDEGDDEGEEEPRSRGTRLDEIVNVMMNGSPDDVDRLIDGYPGIKATQKMLLKGLAKSYLPRLRQDLSKQVATGDGGVPADVSQRGY